MAHGDPAEHGKKGREEGGGQGQPLSSRSGGPMARAQAARTQPHLPRERCHMRHQVQNNALQELVPRGFSKHGDQCTVGARSKRELHSHGWRYGDVGVETALGDKRNRPPPLSTLTLTAIYEVALLFTPRGPLPVCSSWRYTASRPGSCCMMMVGWELAQSFGSALWWSPPGGCGGAICGARSCSCSRVVGESDDAPARWDSVWGVLNE